VVKLLLWQEIAILLKLDAPVRSMLKTGESVAGALISLGILQGADQADHLAYVAQTPRGLDRRRIPCKGAYMEAKEQKSHTRSDIFG